jgi:hypothetical protein
MLTYEEILKHWFYLLIPHDMSFEEFEAEPAPEQRAISSDVISKMSRTVQDKTQALFGCELPLSTQCLPIMDKHITPEAAEWWMKDSDPDDPRNFFLITVSEFAVHLGNVLISVAGGNWLYARMPNFFRSTIRIGNLEVSVFDAMMKKCSRDYGDEKLTDKFAAYLNAIQAHKQESRFI